MRLEQIVPPELVAVAGGGYALMLARRGPRCYVQISRGPGLNHLCWVDESALASGGPTGPRAAGIPWRSPRSAR